MASITSIPGEHQRIPLKAIDFPGNEVLQIVTKERVEYESDGG